MSLQAVYTGPEEVIVAAKVRPTMDDLDAALRRESPFVADVYIDVTHGLDSPQRRRGH